MILTDEILLTKHHRGPVGSHKNRYLISDRPIDDLISNLNDQGLEVNPDYSEKEVLYSVRTGPRSTIPKTTTVPLGTEFPQRDKPTAFILRDGKGLELVIRNYDDITESPPEGMIGGTVGGDYGIICKLSTEASKIDITIVDKVREAMNMTYSADYRKSKLTVAEGTQTG